eukprot:4855116-Pyramimonas_sp.AAC.1
MLSSPFSFSSSNLLLLQCSFPVSLYLVKTVGSPYQIISQTVVDAVAMGLDFFSFGNCKKDNCCILPTANATHRSCPLLSPIAPPSSSRSSLPPPAPNERQARPGAGNTARRMLLSGLSSQVETHGDAGRERGGAGQEKCGKA